MIVSTRGVPEKVYGLYTYYAITWQTVRYAVNRPAETDF